MSTETSGLPVSRTLDWIYGKLVNYGVRPWRLAGLAILLVLLGGWFFSHPGAVQLKDKDLRKKEPYSISWGEALNVGAAQFLPASLPIKEILIPSVEPVNVKLWIPSSGATFTLRPSSVATVLQVAGWILVPIGVAAMTGVLMRKKQ